MKSLSHVRLFVTPWTVAYRAPPSMGFSRQEYWSELPFPSPRDLPGPGIEPRSPAFQAASLPAELQGKPVRTLILLWELRPLDLITFPKPLSPNTTAVCGEDVNTRVLRG